MGGHVFFDRVVEEGMIGSSRSQQLLRGSGAGDLRDHVVRMGSLCQRFLDQPSVSLPGMHCPQHDRILHINKSSQNHISIINQLTDTLTVDSSNCLKPVDSAKRRGGWGLE